MSGIIFVTLTHKCIQDLVFLSSTLEREEEFGASRVECRDEVVGPPPGRLLSAGSNPPVLLLLQSAGS